MSKIANKLICGMITMCLCVSFMGFPVSATSSSEINLEVSTYDSEIGYSIPISYDWANTLNMSYSGLNPATTVTLIGSDGLVRVCNTALETDENYGNLFIHEYNSENVIARTLKIPLEFNLFGSVTIDSEGNYYVFTGKFRISKDDTKTLAINKYNPDGELIGKRIIDGSELISQWERYTLTNGVWVPFRSGSCRMAFSEDESLVSVYFSRLMSSGHQANAGLVLDTETFESFGNKNFGQISHVSHSFDQFVLYDDGGFVYLDMGDASPRGIIMSKSSSTAKILQKNINSIKRCEETYNNIYTHLAGFVANSSNYIVCGATEKNDIITNYCNDSRNLFIQIVDKDTLAASDPIWLTDYEGCDLENATNPKIVSIDNERSLILWEKQGRMQSLREYQGTYMAIIDKYGDVEVEPTQIDSIRLNKNDTLKYNKENKKIYWATSIWGESNPYLTHTTYEQIRLCEFTVKEKLDVNISASNENVRIGDKVTFTANASGGAGDYTYSFLVVNKDTNESYRFSDFKDLNTLSWTALSAGEREFYVEVKDSSGTVVKSNAVNINTSSLAVTGISSATDISVGDEITITANASGGIGDYTYSFLVHNIDTQEWHKFSDFKDADILNWKATSAGNRKFYIEVKDSAGTVVRSNAINVVVSEQENPLTVTGSSNITSAAIGEKIIITATAGGGAGNYTYSFLVHNIDTQEWYRFSDFKDSNTLSWVVPSTGDRKFYVEVKDAEGTIVRSSAININITI